MQPISFLSPIGPSSFNQPAHSVAARQPSPLLVGPRRAQTFVADRLLRKSLRAAELAIWEASGGDFLRAVRPS